jgi:hypothetical protein
VRGRGDAGDDDREPDNDNGDGYSAHAQEAGTSGGGTDTPMLRRGVEMRRGRRCGCEQEART